MMGRNEMSNEICQADACKSLAKIKGRSPKRTVSGSFDKLRAKRARIARLPAFSKNAILKTEISSEEQIHEREAVVDQYGILANPHKEIYR